MVYKVLWRKVGAAANVGVYDWRQGLYVQLM